MPKKSLTKSMAQVPAEIDLGAAGKLAENETIEMADLVLPWVKVCQKSAPELDDRENFPNLEYGDLFLQTGEVWKAAEGLIAVPFYYDRTYVEWGPRESGGGFIADHGLKKGSELRKTCTCAEGKKVATRLLNGNDLIETAYWAALVVNICNGVTLEAIFAMSSTHLAVSKEWNTKICKYKMDGAENYIRFARPWKIVTEKKSNDAGSWAIPKINSFVPPGAVTPFHTFNLPNGVAIWQACQRLAVDFKEGFRLQDPETEEAKETDNY